MNFKNESKFSGASQSPGGIYAHFNSINLYKLVFCRVFFNLTETFVKLLLSNDIKIKLKMSLVN